jgi:heme/copper-type cytochrome/quinol oxidase subunit 2
MAISKKTLATIIALWITTITLTVIVTSIYTSVHYNYYAINIFATIILPAIVSAVSTAIPVYIGVVIGVPKEFNNAFDTIEKRMQKSPTAKRAMKLMEMSDKLFGDEQAVEQITGFFKEARALVSSPEAKNFFKNITELMKDLGGQPEVKIKLPKKEVKKT